MKIQLLGRFIYFTQLLARVQLNKIQRDVLAQLNISVEKQEVDKALQRVLGDLSFFLRNESRVQLIRYKARIKPKAKIGNTMTEHQLLRVFIFFAQGLGRVQLIRYKGRIKSKVKLGNLTPKLQLLGIFIYFTQLLARVQLTRYKGRFTLSVSQLSLDQ